MSSEKIHKEFLASQLLVCLQFAYEGTSYPKNNELEIHKTLKFQKQLDFKRYRACIDLFQDTEYAIENGFKYQLGKFDTHNLGERYLRLYGILNAVYLQISALIELGYLLNHSNENLISKKLKGLKVYQLRNLVSSHTVDYDYNSDKMFKNSPNGKGSFRLCQSDLTYDGRNINIIDQHQNTLQFNLIECLREYESEALNILLELIEIMVKTKLPDKEYKKSVRSVIRNYLQNREEYPDLNKIEKEKFYKEVRNLLKKK